MVASKISLGVLDTDKNYEHTTGKPMSEKSQKQIEAEIKALEACKSYVPPGTMFGDDNIRKLNLQIDYLRGEIDVTADEWNDYDDDDWMNRHRLAGTTTSRSGRHKYGMSKTTQSAREREKRIKSIHGREFVEMLDRLILLRIDRRTAFVMGTDDSELLKRDMADYLNEIDKSGGLQVRGENE